jgi:CRISPR/Cas system CSM-associated protein Csm3 (group 7 of RAMP superfamily)
MPKPSWSGDVSRKIVQRIVVEGDLVLQTPAHFGSGEDDDLISMSLLTDPLDVNTPLLTGASISGALRSYLREREHGFRAKIDVAPSKIDAPPSNSVLLFGGDKRDEYGEQSPLIVEDAFGKHAVIELRDGVRLAGASRTGEEDKLFNIELWEAGTTFPLRFELIVRQRDDALVLKRALATALSGFNDGGISIGARKRRGYGQVNVTGWRCKEYNLANTTELLDWIAHGAKELSGVVNPNIMQALGAHEKIADRRKALYLNAQFFLDGSLLIRSGSGPDIEPTAENALKDALPDTMHLHSARPQSSDGNRKPAPILSGTSLAGALRGRAFKIARLIASPSREGEEAARTMIDLMFGSDMNTSAEPEASRVTVYERTVSSVENMLVQNRVSLDRFTGGTRDGALFNEQPLFGDAQSLVTVDLQLENPREYEVGLLLLLLKDLWTGDLPLGGEISIGRGRLRGKSAHLKYQNELVRTWDLLANEVNGVSVASGERQELEDYVDKLHIHLGRSES